MAVFYPLQWFLIPFVQNGRCPFGVSALHLRALLVREPVHVCVSSATQARPDCRVEWRGCVLLFGFRLTSDCELGIVSSVCVASIAALLRPSFHVHCQPVGVARTGRRHGDVAVCRGSADYGLLLVSGGGLLVVSRLPGMSKGGSRLARCPAAIWIGGGAQIVGTFVLVFGIGAVMLIPTAQNWLSRSNRATRFEPPLTRRCHIMDS